jgi:CBS domain containing-hemolysin-like protein
MQVVIGMCVLLFVCLILSGFFSATETAFSSINEIRIKQYARSTKKKLSRNAKRVSKLSEDYTRLISTVLVCNNIVNMTSSSVATFLFTNTLKFGESGVFLATIIMTILVIIFGEILPKTMARNYPERFAMFASGAMSFLCVFLKPLTFGFERLDNKLTEKMDDEEKVTASEDELIDIVEQIEKEGVLEHSESELIQNAINFDDVTVKNAMLAKEKVVAISINDSFDKLAKMFYEQQFTRIPVLDESGENIIGIVNQKDVYSYLYTGEKAEIAKIMSEPIYVSYRKLLSDALEEIQKNKSHMAIVVDNVEDREYLGIITLEDLTEELIGEVYDEHDDIPRVFEIGNHMYHVDGKLTLKYLFDKYLTDTNMPHTKARNIDEWIRETIDSPKKNDEIYYDNLKINLLEVENHHIKLAEIEVLTDYDEE